MAAVPSGGDAFRAAIGTLLASLARVGADARDDEETRFRKALLLLICILILPIALIWGTLSSPPPLCCSPTSSTSRRAPSGCHRRRLIFSSPCPSARTSR
jgi:hypothetical protein